MLRQKYIDEIFYMDTLLSTKKSKKLSRGIMHIQLFLVDNRFDYGVPMESKGQVLHALKKSLKK